jgi:hypothetical protein
MDDLLLLESEDLQGTLRWSLVGADQTVVGDR